MGSISHMLSQRIAGGIKRVLRDPTGRGPLNTRAWFPLGLTRSPFSFADFASDLSAKIHHSHEYNCKMNPVSPPDK